MSVSLTIYPIVQYGYDGAPDATNHALRFLNGIPGDLEAKVRKIPGRPVSRLLLNFCPGPDDVAHNEVDGQGKPLCAVAVSDLVKIVRSYVSEDWQSQSYAVVAFLSALQSGAECVPYFN